MYRKFQSSAKYSRHERLAQLSEQESVIEKKKREILAKVEAQKKKETEALRKLEPSNFPINLGKDDNILPFNKHSSRREKEVEDERPKVACLKNVFSNDGSFLDQFKKLSSSMNKKKIDILTVPNFVRSKKDSDGDGSSKTNCKKSEELLDNCERREYELSENEEIRNERIQNSNVQHQFSTSGLDRRISNRQGAVPPPCLSKNQDLTLNNTGAELKPTTAVLNQESPNSTTYQRNFDVTPDVSLTLSLIPPKAVESIVPKGKHEEGLLENSLQLQASPAASTSYQLGGSFTDGESSPVNISGNLLVVAEYGPQKAQPQKEEPMTRFCSDETSRINSPSDTISRISPALTNVEEKNGNEEHLRDPLCQERERAFPCTRRHGNIGSPIRTCEIGDLLENKRNMPGMGLLEEISDRRKRIYKNSEYDSTDSDSNSKDCFRPTVEPSHHYQEGQEKSMGYSDGYQADCDEESSYSNNCEEQQKKSMFQESSANDSPLCKEGVEHPGGGKILDDENSSSSVRQKRKRKSRWGDEVIQGNSTKTSTDSNVQLSSNILPVFSGLGAKTPMLSKLTRSDPGLLQYARQTFGSTNLSEEDWKKAEDHYKINLLYQDMVKKRAEIDRLEKAGKFKYEYDSDEDVEGGTWEHKLRQQEMMATQLWAEELTRQAAGKHHIGDFLPPEELERFMEKYNAVKQGRNPDLSDYKEFKLKEDNVGYRLLQKMGWNEGEGLGQDGNGITNPVNKASTRHENQGLGVDRPDGLQAGDDEYDAYRKRMMLAYRFRPNPLNNPRRPYY